MGDAGPAAARGPRGGRAAHPAPHAGAPFGGAFIGAIAAGTSGYILWLVYEAVFDPYGFGKTLKGAAERIGIALSTFAYGVIVAAAARVLLGDGPDGRAPPTAVVATVLHWPAGAG